MPAELATLKIDATKSKKSALIAAKTKKMAPLITKTWVSGGNYCCSSGLILFLCQKSSSWHRIGKHSIKTTTIWCLQRRRGRENWMKRWNRSRETTSIASKNTVLFLSRWRTRLRWGVRSPTPVPSTKVKTRSSLIKLTSRCRRDPRVELSRHRLKRMRRASRRQSLSRNLTSGKSMIFGMTSMKWAGTSRLRKIRLEWN